MATEKCTSKQCRVCFSVQSQTLKWKQPPASVASRSGLYIPISTKFGFSLKSCPNKVCSECFLTLEMVELCTSISRIWCVIVGCALGMFHLSFCLWQTYNFACLKHWCTSTHISLVCLVQKACNPVGKPEAWMSFVTKTTINKIF